MENINKIQIVPDEVYEIGADKAPVIPEWSVKDDETLRKKVEEMSHSTFDRSKFGTSSSYFTRINGTPTYENGIYTNITSNNYLYLYYPESLIDITKPFSLEIDCKMNTSVSDGWYRTSGTEDAWRSGCWTAWLIKSGTQIKSARSDYSVDIDGTRTTISSSASGDNIPLTTDTYKLIYSFDGTSYKFTLKNINTGAMSVTNGNSSYYLAADYGIKSIISFISGALIQEFDLKTLLIKQNGVEVFSGNKTGIDTIKPDDYTVVGSPTISADGVASGFSASNYISISPVIQLGDYNSWEIETPKLTVSTSSRNLQVIFWAGYNTWNGGIRIMRSSTNGKFVVTLASTTSTDKDIGSISSTIVPVADKMYQLKLKFTGAQYILYVREEDGEWQQDGNIIDSTTKIYNGLNLMSLGGNGQSGWQLVGQLDLNAFKVYVDGDLVYQPCLKIPYTESKTGSKIVDSIYRDRVKDLFEQEGYNIYYTLGEDDFTLPSNKPNDIVKYKANGLTVAEQRADQTLTIRGACESGTDVNLPMDFFDADSYAVFGVATTGTNTASKFTPAADGNYIAIGKGKV